MFGELFWKLQFLLRLHPHTKARMKSISMELNPLCSAPFCGIFMSRHNIPRIFSVQNENRIRRNNHAAAWKQRRAGGIKSFLERIIWSRSAHVVGFFSMLLSWCCFVDLGHVLVEWKHNPIRTGLCIPLVHIINEIENLLPEIDAKNFALIFF